MSALCQPPPAPAPWPTVVVTAARFDDSAVTLPMGVSVITQADIAQAGVLTVGDALIKLLGVHGRVDLYGGGDYGLDLRGFGATAANNQVVIVDGVPVTEADLGGTRLSGIAIDQVAKIEVLRGSGAVLYGSGATGGVIRITTRAGRGADRSNQASLYTAAGSDGLHDNRASATLAGGGFSIDLAANQRRSDNHRDNFKSDADGSTVQTQWHNDVLRLGLGQAQDALDTGLPGALSATQYQTTPTLATTPADRASLKNTRQTAFARADLGAWQWALDAGHRSKTLDSVMSTMGYRYDVEANTLALRARHQARVGPLDNAVTVGYDQSDWTRTVAGSFGTVSQQKTQAFYGQDDVTLAQGGRLFAGYRSDLLRQSDNTDALGTDTRLSAWELGLSQPLTDTLTAYARTGTSYRLPNVDERAFVVQGAVLQPQTSRDTELGGRWNAASHTLDLRYYRNDLTSELGYDPTVANPQSWNPANLGANVNLDPTMRQGLELEAYHTLSASWTLQATLALRQARFTRGVHDGLDVPLVAHRSLSLRADWHTAPSHSVNAGVVMQSPQSVDFQNQCMAPGHITTDARYAYQVRDLELSLGINNLLDSRYYTQAFTCSAGVTGGIYPEPGRALTAALRINF